MNGPSAAGLARRLDAETIVPLEWEAWEALAPELDELERHDTFVAGDLVIGRLAGRLVAVEEPGRDERVVRLLADEAAARAFVEDRKATYERMFEGGCGCKVEYYR